MPTVDPITMAFMSALSSALLVRSCLATARCSSEHACCSEPMDEEMYYEEYGDPFEADMQAVLEMELEQERSRPEPSPYAVKKLAFEVCGACMHVLPSSNHDMTLFCFCCASSGSSSVSVALLFHPPDIPPRRPLRTAPSALR